MIAQLSGKTKFQKKVRQIQFLRGSFSLKIWNVDTQFVSF